MTIRCWLFLSLRSRIFQILSFIKDKKKDDKRKKHKTIEVPIQEIDKKEKHQQNDTKRVKNKQKAKKREKKKDSKKTTSTAKCIKQRTFSTIKEKR